MKVGIFRYNCRKTATSVPAQLLLAHTDCTLVNIFILLLLAASGKLTAPRHGQLFSVAAGAIACLLPLTTVALLGVLLCTILAFGGGEGVASGR